MENQKSENVSSSECKVIHVKVVGGSAADVYEIGKAMQELKKKLPYRLEAIVTTDRIELTDINSLLQEFIKLKKQLDTEQKIMGRKGDSN